MADEQITNSLAGPYKTLTGYLSNAVYRGASVQLQIANDTMLQMKYEDDEDWVDLVDLKLVQDYESLLGKPTINGKEIIGEIEGEILSPSNALTIEEINGILNNDINEIESMKYLDGNGLIYLINAIKSLIAVNQNLIEIIKVNGVPLEIDNDKSVNIEIQNY